MAQTHDTIDGLLAEFRGYSAGMPASYHVTMSWADFRKMLDRFEWAHDHDIATATEACARAVVDARVKQREAERKCVALREALDEAENGLFRWQSGSMNRDTHRKLIAMIKTALAAPPRNCDVGTEEEQSERFDKFCHANINTERCCGDCPAFRTTRDDCELVWAQLPYEEGGAK